jgi:hypothetical protein
MSNILAFIKWLYNIKENLIPFGWQDEFCFHYGKEETNILHCNHEDKKEDK